MSENKARGPMMGGHRSRAMNSGEKAKDFKGAMKRLLKYMERYKIRFVLMFLFAIAGTIFNTDNKFMDERYRFDKVCIKFRKLYKRKHK